MDGLLPLDEARNRVLEAVPALAPLELPLLEAYGCVMATDAVAEYDIPPFSSATMDGFALRAADVEAATFGAPASLRIAGWAVSGRPPDATVGWSEAVRVSTGAPLPAGADAVAPMSACSVLGETVQVAEAVAVGTGVRPAGEDVRSGEVLVPAGRRLTSPEIGMLAQAGLGSALAYPQLRVAVFAIGAGLIEPGRPAPFGSQREAASYVVVAELRELGAVPYRLGIVSDVENDLRETLLSNLSRADAFVCAGAVGEEDVTTIGPLLSGLGDVRGSHVALYPGGAHAFGLVDGKPFFGVPSSTVSAFVAFETLVRPAILRMMGRRDVQRPEVAAVLDQPVSGPPGVTLMVPARVSRRDGTWHAAPTGAAGPDLLAGVVRANGMVVVPPGNGSAPAGTSVRAQVFRSPAG